MEQIEVESEDMTPATNVEYLEEDTDMRNSGLSSEMVAEGDGCTVGSAWRPWRN